MVDKPHAKLVVGLTGGIGSGKSSVTALFVELGVCVIDTDLLAREVVQPATSGLRAVVAQFGDDILDTTGNLDRAKLRQLVFSDDQQRLALEAILHPLIRKAMHDQIDQSTSAYCIVCIPLLFETSQADSVDRVLVVDVPREVQLERTLARDGSPRETIEGILAAQLDRQERLARADDVIDNSAEQSALRPQVNVLHQRYLAAAKQKDALAHRRNS